MALYLAVEKNRGVARNARPSLAAGAHVAHLRRKEKRPLWRIVVSTHGIVNKMHLDLFVCDSVCCFLDAMSLRFETAESEC